MSLAGAVLDLLPEGVQVFDGQVTVSSPTPPWVLVTVRENRTERSLGRPSLVRTVDVRALVYGASTESVRVVSALVDGALEGATPTESGWKTTPLEQVNAREPVEDPNVVLNATARRPMYAVLEYRFTASPTA